MNSLEELASRELKLEEHVARAVGLMEDKDRQLRSDGVYAESAAVHAAYVDLAAPPGLNAEALKRATFLGWSSDVGPSCFTGVADIDPAGVRRTHDLLDAAARSGRLDVELDVMLGWYWFIADYHFTFNSSARLVQYVSQLNPEAYKTFGFSRQGLEGRGLMGRYWTSVACRD